jgi:hypothetical protein
MIKQIGSRYYLALIFLLLSTVACRPVITIGWQEIGILVVLLLILLGPPLYRLFKRYDEFQNWKSKRGDTKTDD